MEHYQDVFARVAAWNALRYDQVFNLTLLTNLLDEEFNEMLTDETPVLKLDGYCDTIYVALGGLWKLGEFDINLANAFGEAGVTIDEAAATGAFNTVEDINTAIALNLAALKSDKFSVVPQTLANVLAAICLLCHMAAERKFGVNVYAALEIVCDSNDTKAVKKTAANVKANIDKGATFVAPEPRLQALLDEVQNVKH